MKKYLHVLISVLLIIGAAGMIFFWEMYLDDKINTVDVVVAAKNLAKDQVIKEGDVKIDKVKLNQVVENPIKDIRSVIGKETSQYIARGHQFVNEMIDLCGIEPNDDQLIYSIPKEWIYSSPGSLRRKDRVCIYPIPDEKRFNGSSSAGAFQFNNQNPGGTSEPILNDIAVAFAKDSANQEVKPVTNSEKRIDATGSINHLELVMTQHQYSLLEQKYLAGFNFNFAYK